jgi:hypothetical protein
MQCDCGYVVREKPKTSWWLKSKSTREVHDMEITRGWKVKAVRKGKGGKR